MPMNISANVGNGGAMPAGQSDLANYLQIIQGVIQRMSNMSFMIGPTVSTWPLIATLE